MDKLNDQQVEQSLQRLDDWRLDGSVIKKDFEFSNFTAAMGFINDLATTAESINHHPDWANSYNRVSISLTSHEAGGLTSADFQLAEAADRLAGLY